jgi:hypothetical protein
MSDLFAYLTMHFQDLWCLYIYVCSTDICPISCFDSVTQQCFMNMLISFQIVGISYLIAYFSIRNIGKMKSNLLHYIQNKTHSLLYICYSIFNTRIGFVINDLELTTIKLWFDDGMYARSIFVFQLLQ